MDVFAALVAVVNARLPCVDRRLLVRLVLRVRHAHASGNRQQLAAPAAAAFVSHLVDRAWRSSSSQKKRRGTPASGVGHMNHCDPRKRGKELDR